MDDADLLGFLNKAVAAFAHEPRFVDRRRTPDGGESSDERIHSSQSGERVAEGVPTEFSKKPSLEKSLSQASSKFSMRTASESSARLEEEYYTADEESEPGSSAKAAPDSPRPPSSSAASLRSFGFVLAHSEDEDEDFTRHERLEDFRRRIRRRTRRRISSRRSSSYSSGGSSSDMEDITEDPEENARPVVTIRPACSEPTLVALTESAKDIPPWVSPGAFLSLCGQRQLAATCSGGHLKSYSHDGVRPNLPVPFRARFRVKKKSHESYESRSVSCTEDKEWMTSRCPVAVTAGGGNKDPQLTALVLWLAASMAQLPALILYTMNEPSLTAVIEVYNQVLNRQWTIGDLACEVLRFCRNQTMPGHRAGKHAYLFKQLMAAKNVEEQPAQTRKLFTEESLD